MTKDIKQEKLSQLFGVTSEEVEQSKSILPTLDLGNLKVGNTLKIKFLETTPKEIETESKFQKGKQKVKILKVLEISLGETFEQGAREYTMWLSAKTLQLEIAKLYMANNETLDGVKAEVSVTIENFALGENRCYHLRQI
jgi:hypothetical protein